MARPTKAGLDYFPLDVVVDDKINLIEAKHDIVGFAVVIKLYQQIYKNSYFIKISEDRLLLLRKKMSIDIETLNNIIADCLKWEIFNQDLFDKYNILTSCGIQKRYIEATKRRKEVEFIKEYLIVNNLKDKYKDNVDVIINELNANINDKEANINPQSKVKESKVKNKDICPQQTILDLYHKILPEGTHHKSWDGNRAAALKARWNEKHVNETTGYNSSQIEYWEGLFKFIRGFDFLMGEKEPTKGYSRFQISLDRIVKKQMFIDIIEGSKYANR